MKKNIIHDIFSKKKQYLCIIKQLERGITHKTVKIMTTFNFTTKQEGYGRQGLYFSFDGKQHFIQSVFPNVAEYFNVFELREDCFGDEENGFTDCNGRELTPIDSWDEFLTENFKEEIGRILFESLDYDDYDFDFENATYEEIAEWAANY